MDDHAIASLSLQCSRKFMGIKRDIAARATVPDFSFPENFPFESLSDVFARFLIWVGNIGALSRGKASLDQRIRQSDLRKEIIRLLEQIIIVLGDLSEILNGQREQQVWYKGNSNAIDLNDSDSDTESDISSHLSAGTFTPEEDDPRLVTESSELGMMLNEFVKSLLKLSLLIQRSSRKGRFTRSSREQPYDTRIDILHVQELFPFAADKTYLTEKLGKANSQRRQWLSYRRHHRERLSSVGGPKTESNLGMEELFAESDSQWPADFASTVSASSRPPLSLSMTDNSTTATTFYDEFPEIVGTDQREDQGSEISFSASSVSGKQKARLEVPRLPTEGISGDPFECPFCYTIVSVSSIQSWIKHVHSDLVSYVCTFRNCHQPPFESRVQWFDHEMDCHRRVWSCPYCKVTAQEGNILQQHIHENHNDRVSQAQIEGLVRQTSHPLQRVAAASCPLCDYDSILRERMPALGTAGLIMIKPEQLRSHLGRHLEQLAVFVLPKSALMHEVDDEDNEESGSDESNPPDDDSDEPKNDALIDVSIDEVLIVLDLQSERLSHILDEAPALALGWQPPHDFTPPSHFFEADDEDTIPRREESTFGGDLFTPGWVRGYGKTKEGWCGRCVTGHWVNIPSADYEFHLTYLHGLPYTGLPLPRPSAIREIEAQEGSWEGYCDICNSWRILRRTKRGWNWWRHCLTEHGAVIANISSMNPLLLEEVQSTEMRNMRKAVTYIRQAEYQNFNEILREFPDIIVIGDADGKLPIHYASEAGRENFVQLILDLIQLRHTKREARNLMNHQTRKGLTPLMLAIHQGNQGVVELLAKSDADLHLRGEDGNNALDIAAHTGYISICKMLIEYGARIENSRLFREICLHAQTPYRTVSTRDTLAPKEDASKRVSVWSGLMSEASRNDVGGILDYLNQGADIEETAEDGSTALTIAVLRGSLEAADILIENGANLNAINLKGWTALMVAVRDANYSAVKFLLEYGADANHLSPDHWTGLAEAAQGGYLNILDILLEYGADTEVRSSHDWTPLMHACYRGDKACVEKLLDHGAGVESGSQRDETPILLASAAGHTEVVRILLEAGGCPDAAWAQKEVADAMNAVERTYKLGWTPLMTACQNGHEDIVLLLIEAGANTEPRSPLKRNALEIARENGRTAIADILEDYMGRN